MRFQPHQPAECLLRPGGGGTLHSPGWIVGNTFDSLDPEGEPARGAILGVLSEGEVPISSDPHQVDLDAIVDEMGNLRPAQYTVVLPAFESRVDNVRLFVERKDDGTFLVEGYKGCID